MSWHRIRTGVRRFPDGWNVIVEIDGETTVYDPTYATEAEAEAKSRQVAKGLREVLS